MGRRLGAALVLAMGVQQWTGCAPIPVAAQTTSTRDPQPCLLTFSREALLADGNGPLAVSRGRLRTFHDNCLDVQLVRGEATALVRRGERYITLKFESGRLNPNQFTAAAPSNGLGLLALFREFFGPVPFGAGSRSGTDEPSRFLSRAFSGTLIVGADGLAFPVAGGPLESVSAFRIVSGNVLRDPIAGVQLVAGVIRIPAGALRPGQSYGWEASITTPAGTSVLSGAFDVATAAEIASMEDALRTKQAAFETGDSGFLLEAAALYEERGHAGNAALLTAQWFAAK